MNQKPGMFRNVYDLERFVALFMLVVLLGTLVYVTVIRRERPMAKVTISVGGGHAYFYCPGCRMTHHYQIKAPASAPDRDTWEFNGDVSSPTFTPSLHWIEEGKTRCHLYVKAGRIEYLPDCAHELAGQTVDMVDEGAP